ncbi:MAG: alpha/beta hydrolase [Verrucomicrobiales bacterium]
MLGISPVFRRLTGAITLLMLPACAFSPPLQGQAVRMEPEAKVWVARDGTRFPYQSWIPEKQPVKAIVIGLHGLSGAACDHQIAALALQKNGYAFFGCELRGQGNDPVKERRGDIRSVRQWHEDVWDFHRLATTKYPDLPVIWLAESLGSLIACGAVSSPPAGTHAPDALVLASTIPAFDERVAIWQRQLLGFGALWKPERKIPLSDWTGPDAKDWQMTGASDHLQQLDVTPWAVKEFTVRFYHSLSLMVGRMMPQATRIKQPVLIVHAEKDVFASMENVQAFAKRLPNARLQRYEKSHHLLFYDTERDQVVADIVRWIESAPWKSDDAKTAQTEEEAKRKEAGQKN